VIRTYSRLEVEEEMAKSRRAESDAAEEKKLQHAKDSITIVQYLKTNKHKGKRTGEGVYYVIRKSSKGKKFIAGDTVTTHYTGKFLDGTKFDSSYDRNQPFTFVVGVGQVIQGWDEGFMMLKKGEKATLYIPSGMAYGERGAGASIPPNAILIFDVEILK
jgi:peptidyl-prolyl cis-trans isomerase A (cyclophilin A)